MKNKERYLVSIIEKIARKNKITIEKFSYDWVIRLSKNGKRKHIFGYKFEINSATASMMTDDKTATSDLLKADKIPAVEHKLFLNPFLQNYIGKNGNWKQITKYAENNNFKIVCKPVVGTGGNNIHLSNSQNELENIIHKLFRKHRAVCLSPFYKVKYEYRVITLNQKSELIYRKEIPKITGDGQKTILELLMRKFENTEINQSIFDFIKTINYKLNHVLNKAEILKLNWKSNLGKGAKPKIIKNSELSKKLSELAEKATKTLNINFASVDIIETIDNQFLILEINSGIMMENFVENMPEKVNKVEKIYEKAVLQMFR